MTDQAAPRAAIVVAMPDAIDYGTADRAHDQLYAAFTAARHAELRLAVPLASPVRRILQITGLDQQFGLSFRRPRRSSSTPGYPQPAPRAPDHHASPRRL